VNLLPGFVSPADLRYIKEIFEDFGMHPVILPDISETLDGPAIEDYEKIPHGGTPIEDIANMGGSLGTIELGRTMQVESTAGSLLRDRFDVPLYQVGTPIGLRESDRFFEVLEELSGSNVPPKHWLERGRLVDAFVDAHKYVFGKRAVVYGEEDLVVGLTAFLAEIGVEPVLCVTGGRSGKFREAIEKVTADILAKPPLVREDEDFFRMAEEAKRLSPDILIGHSKGYHLARRWGIPLVRVGFPIHDRFGAQRTLHVGYRGAQTLLDRIVNAVIEGKQEESEVGYGYI
jgi:nitrogenase molybdenum-iron protein NifN